MTLAETFPGLRVLDLATNIAGPFAAMILGDMGADVIKVERMPAGDDTRALPPFVDGQATVFCAVNRNKRSILLNYKADDDRKVLDQLIANADVVIESFPPGVAHRLDLGWEALSHLNDRLVLGSVSAFGDGDTGGGMPGYDALVQAVSGLMSFTGNEGEPTVRMAPSVLDLSTGTWLAMGIMAALQRRAFNGGKGEHVRMALLDTAFNLMNHQLLGYLATGETPRKLGSGAPSASPYGVYPASDGEILIATASQDQFYRLCDCLGLAQAKIDPRFQAMQGRIESRTALDQLIASVTAAKTVDELLEILSAGRISCGRVNTVGEACDLAVTAERNLLVPQSGGGLPQLRLPFDIEAPASFLSPPTLDQHRDQILAELANLQG